MVALSASLRGQHAVCRSIQDPYRLFRCSHPCDFAFPGRIPRLPPPAHAAARALIGRASGACRRVWSRPDHL